LPHEIDLNIVKNIISLLEVCTDSFAFVYDISSDLFFISERTLAHYDLPGARVFGAVGKLIMFIHEDERVRCAVDIESIISNKKESIRSSYHIRNRYGEYVPAEVRMRRIAEAWGEIVAGSINPAEKHAFFEDDSLASERDAQFDFDTARMNEGSLSGFAMQIEVDNFISINEHAGFEAGNEILSILAQACKKQCVNGTKIYLLSDRKFLLMNFTGGNADEIRRSYSGIKQSIRDAEYASGYKRVFTISAGGIAFINDTSTLTEILAKLVFTVDFARKDGKDMLELFNAREYANYLRTLEIESAVRDSIKNKFEGFTLLFQPIVNAKTVQKRKGGSLSKIVIGAESLLRWKNERFGTLGAELLGVITGTYTNGVRQKEAQIAMAQFNNPSGLTKMGGNLYQESNNSGTRTISGASDIGTELTTSALEMSNVDIADQFSDMIITQRGFQSNSKIITVSDEMLETLINMKR